MCHVTDRSCLQGVLLAHDRVAAQQAAAPAHGASSDDENEREYLYERASQYGEDSIKIVRLQKTADPLVCSVRAAAVSSQTCAPYTNISAVSGQGDPMLSSDQVSRCCNSRQL